MTIVFDDRHGVWVAMGVHEGRPYLAEGATPEDAYNSAAILISETRA